MCDTESPDSSASSHSSPRLSPSIPASSGPARRKDRGNQLLGHFFGHRALGIELRDPVVVPNTVDPRIFFPPRTHEPISDRNVRLIATSWSDNPLKGGEILEWLDRNLDRSRFELTLLGRFPGTYAHARVLSPVPSEAVA